MTRRGGFRLFLVVQFLYAIVMGIFGDLVLTHAPTPTLSGLQIGLGIVLLVTSIGGFVGIWLFRRWGRLLYTASVLITLVNLAIAPVHRDAPVAVAWIAVSWLLTGITVTLIHASPVATEFASTAA